MNKFELNTILEESLQLVRPYCEKLRKPSLLFFKSENMRKVKSSIVEKLHAGLSSTFEELKNKSECAVIAERNHVIRLVEEAKKMNDLIESVHVNFNPFHQSEFGKILETMMARLQPNPLMDDQDEFKHVINIDGVEYVATQRELGI